MARTVLWGAVMIALVSLLESTLLVRLSILPVVPDLALIVLIYISYVNGAATGQTLGFVSGFVLDFVSAAPLGYNAFIRTVLGALTGLLKGTFFLDTIILPIILVASATFAKALLAGILSVMFSGALPTYDLLASQFWAELGLNALLAPPFFAFLKLFDTALRPRRNT